MEGCDALIVGGGPAGSTLAWRLARAGLDVVLLEKEKYPREKVCGGWITPAVVRELELDLAEYADGRTLQSITGFRAGLIGRRTVQTAYNGPVSYGVRRCEFDSFLAGRSGARILDGMPLVSLKQSHDGWIVNDRFWTPLLVGAGGHYCPVARALGSSPGSESAIVARQAEILLDQHQRQECAVQGETPELYFCRDMKGYGWCFRKGDYLNVGLGRADAQGLNDHLEGFIGFLRESGRVSCGISGRFTGHAYLLYGGGRRNIVADRALLVGDAAGLAFALSGEGIRPAILSGILAADAILGAGKTYSRDRLQSYCRLLESRFGPPAGSRARALASLVPGFVTGAVAGFLLTRRWFTRRVLLDRWFLGPSRHADPIG